MVAISPVSLPAPAPAEFFGVARPSRGSPGPTAVDSMAVAPPAIPCRIAAPPPQPFGADYAAKMDTLAGGVAYTPSIKYLRSGTDALSARLDAIAQAKSSIFMTTYAIEADDVTASVLRALIARAEEGLAVVVKCDAFPSTYIQGENSDEANTQMFMLMRQLEAAGGVVMFYGTERDQRVNTGCGDHLKLLLTDGSLAIAGGRNMSSDYFGEWRDLDGAFEGSVATRLGQKALAMARHGDPHSLNRWTGEDATMIASRMTAYLDRVDADLAAAARRATATGVPCWVTAWDPTYDERVPGPGENENTNSQALIEAFNRAQREIIVSSNWANGNENVHAALLAAAKRGVAVTVVTTGEALSTRSILPYLAAETRYGELRKYGARIMETTKQIDHAKMYAIDCDPPPAGASPDARVRWTRGVAAFGSYNLEHAADDHLVEQLVWSMHDTHTQYVRDALLSDVNEICTEYLGPRKLGFFEQIARWFLTLLALMTEGLF